MKCTNPNCLKGEISGYDVTTGGRWTDKCPRCNGTGEVAEAMDDPVLNELDDYHFPEPLSPSSGAGKALGLIAFEAALDGLREGWEEIAQAVTAAACAEKDSEISALRAEVEEKRGAYKLLLDSHGEMYTMAAKRGVELSAKYAEISALRAAQKELAEALSAIYMEPKSERAQKLVHKVLMGETLRKFGEGLE